jgi:hypothetical protein
MALTSEEVNYLVYRYLQESGKLEESAEGALLGDAQLLSVR